MDSKVIFKVQYRKEEDTSPLLVSTDAEVVETISGEANRFEQNFVCTFFVNGGILPELSYLARRDVSSLVSRTLNSLRERVLARDFRVKVQFDFPDQTAREAYYEACRAGVLSVSIHWDYRELALHRDPQMFVFGGSVEESYDPNAEDFLIAGAIGWMRRRLLSLECSSETLNEVENFLLKGRSSENSNIGVFEITMGEELAERNYGGIWGVGRAGNTTTSAPSGYLDRRPFLMNIEYRGAPASHEIDLQIFAKGVLFDTGGVCIKTDNTNMHKDKYAAMLSIALLSCAAEMKLPLNIKVTIPFVFNLISPGALLPEERVTLKNSERMGIKNTDAEGRIILADAISGTERWARHSLVLATLTYPLYEDCHGYYWGGRSNSFAQLLLDSRKRTGENLSLDVAENHLDQINSALSHKSHNIDFYHLGQSKMFYERLGLGCFDRVIRNAPSGSFTYIDVGLGSLRSNRNANWTYPHIVPFFTLLETLKSLSQR